MIKVEYKFEGDEMSDEEYYRQEELTFEITEDMIEYGGDISLDLMITKLESYRETYTSQGYIDLIVNMSKYDWDNNREITLEGSCLETDEQFEHRIALEKRQN